MLAAPLLLLLPALASPGHEAFEAQIRAELEALDKDAVPIFERANAAREQRNFQEASELYAEVARRVPAFHHADRRRCGAELALGHHADALDLCRRALSRAQTDQNRLSMAFALISLPRASEREIEEASDYVDPVLKNKPSDFEPYSLAAYIAARKGQWNYARTMLHDAKMHGLPEQEFTRLSRVIDEAEPFTSHWEGTIVRFLGAWIAAFLALLVVGSALSYAALRISRRLPTEKSWHAHGLDALLRRVYRVVLWLSCVYYYVSMPIVLAIVVLGGGGLVYGVISAGHIPVKLVFLVGVGVIVTLGAVLKSLAARGTESDPGMELTVQAHPKLEAVLAEVAAKLKTHPVETVFVTPETGLAVFERGTLLQQLRGGGSKRCLILGLGILDGMRVRELKGILAHEYGHFVNEDTAGGGFSLAVRRSLRFMIVGLARGGAASWFNPAWLFAIGFQRVFLRISLGASRLQEVLADRWSAFAYGSDAFEKGLRHAIERSVRFSAHVDASVREVLETKAPLTNLYRFEPASPVPEDKIAEVIEEHLNAEPSPLDSHPSPHDRIAWVRALSAEGEPMTESDAAPAWSLFTDREALESALSAAFRDRLNDEAGLMIRG